MIDDSEGQIMNMKTLLVIVVSATVAFVTLFGICVKGAEVNKPGLIGI